MCLPVAVSYPCSAIGWSVVCASGISLSYLLVFFACILFIKAKKIISK